MICPVEIASDLSAWRAARVGDHAKSSRPEKNFVTVAGTDAWSKTRFTGPAKNDPSSFNLITTDLELADQRISSRVIDIDGYGVDVDGSGSVSVSGSDDLNYRGLAEITTKESFFTSTVARLSGATLKNGKLQIPFRIGGMIDSPVFSKGKGDRGGRAESSVSVWQCPGQN
jgi:hypothetical protein